MKIIYFLNSIAVGGMEMHALTLAAALQGQSWPPGKSGQADVGQAFQLVQKDAGRAFQHDQIETLAVLPDYPVLDDLVAQFQQARVPVHRFTLEGASSAGPAPVKQFQDLVHWLRSERPDILHQQRTGAYHGKWGVLAARLAGVPIVLATEHGAAYRLNGARRYVTRLFERLVDCIISVCEGDRLRQVHIAGRPSSKTALVYNGIDTAYFSPASTEQVEQGRVDLGVDPAGLLIGVVARLDEQKGLFYFLEALRLLMPDYPNLTALLVGDGPLRERLESAAVDLGVVGAVRFVGHSRDVVRYLRLMDVFVLPSLFESFPLVTLEAMSTAVPVVATTVGGLAENVAQDETGLLVPAQDAAALAQSISRLLADPALRKMMGQAGRRRVVERFSIETMTMKTLAVYQRLMEAHAR